MTKMRSQQQFSNVPRADIPRSSFNLSHGHKTTFDADYLVPILGPIDIIPGDTFNVRASFFMRLATPLFPIMDNMYVDTFFFFVPYRLLWVNFEKFHGAQDDPGDSIVFTVPISSNHTVVLGSLQDYMGLPMTNAGVDYQVLPFRAYNKIYNDWFRDENLQNSITVDTDNGPDTIANYTLLKRGKRFDYFTSCLPAPQKGAAVSMPLGTSAEIHTSKSELDLVDIYSVGEAGYRSLETAGTSLSVDTVVGNVANVMFADLSGATAATINDIRLAFQTQRLLERDARSGTRYVETLKAHWGVTSPDFRLQRAEFLGGGSEAINVTPVAQQSAQTTPVANDTLGHLSGFGTVSGTHSFSKSFVEHGVLLGLANVRGDITYSQGLDRMWSKSTRYDFYYPVLSGIGEQAVLNQEIWWSNGAPDLTVFGYQERYGEYRFQNNRLSSLMRPDATGTLAAWNVSEDFATLPSLGASFITANLGVPLDRAIQIPTEPHFIADFFFDIKAARPLPVYGIPGNLDRL